MSESTSDKVDRQYQKGKRKAKEAGREAADWAEPMARVGYAAKGVVYVAAGLLSAAFAFGYGGQTAGTKSAVRAIGAQPFGQALLIIIAVGLFAYTGWRFIEAFIDPEGIGNDAKGLTKRAIKGISGFLYAGLGIYAANLSQGTASGGGGSKAQTWSAKVMQWPGGEWLVGLAGGAIGIYGLAQAWRGKELEFLDNLKEHEIGRKERKGIRWVGQIGLWARGVVFLMIGAFLIVAAVQSQPQEALGLQGALYKLLAQPYGQWLMGLVALGLASYGVFCFVKAKYRRIRA